MNSRQHRFILNLFQGMNQTDAYINAGYHCADPGTAAACATELLKLPNISQELARLMTKREAIVTANVINASISPSVLTKAEKRSILAEIARARLVDFQDKDGQPALTGDTPNNKAAKEFYHRQRFDRNGNPIITKSIKLVDAIEAIREDNKMTGDYAPSKHLIGQKVIFEINQVEKKKRGEE